MSLPTAKPFCCCHCGAQVGHEKGDLLYLAGVTLGRRIVQFKCMECGRWLNWRPAPPRPEAPPPNPCGNPLTVATAPA